MALTYYFYSDGNCTTSTCRLEAGFVFSLDGGSRWSDPIVLTSNPMPLSWVASTGQGAMVGDYVSTSFSEAATVAVFSAADPKDTSFHQAIYAATPVVPRSTGSTT
ncbi:MAG: sialidase family protein, partial [Acidimicrobiales bacterium]